MININSWAEFDEKIYMNCYENYPGTFCFDKKTKKFQTIKESSEIRNGWNKLSFYGSFAIGNYAVFMPYFSKYFMIVNSLTDEVSLINKKMKAYYHQSFIYQGKGYMFPDGQELYKVAVFDPETKEISYPYENNSEMKKISSYWCGCGQFQEKKGVIYFPFGKKDSIATLDLESQEVKITRISEWNVDYGVIAVYENGYLLSGNQPYIFMWDGKNQLQRIPLDVKYVRSNLSGLEQMFSKACWLGDKLILTPLMYGCIICIDHGKIRYLNKLQCDDEFTWGYGTFNNDIFISTRDMSGKIIHNYLLKNNLEIQQCDYFKITKNIDLTGYGYEYSEFMLKIFLDKIVR